MTGHAHLTEQTAALLRKHRRELIKIAKHPHWSDAKKDEERERLAAEIDQERIKLQAAIKTARAQRAATPVGATSEGNDSTDDVAALDRAWDRIAPQLQSSRSLATTVGELVTEAGQQGDNVTIKALERHLPGFIHAANRGESQQTRDTIIRGMQQLIEQQARPFLPDQERLEAAKYDRTAAGKDDARFMFLTNGLTEGLKDPERDVVLPDFNDATVTVPRLSALGAEDDD